MKPSTAFVVRLSRDDLSQPGTLEEKFALRLSLCRELASRFSLPEPEPENILVEQISGRNLSKRAAFRALLDKCETGEITHIVTPYQDRLLRGDKRDEADIEDALLAGNVTLITTEGLVEFNEDYESRHALTFEVRALAARHYLRDVIKKLKESNRQRSQQGQRSAGMAPYGYQWVKAVYTGRQKAAPGHYEIVGELALTDESAALAWAKENAPDCLQSPDALNSAAYLALARRRSRPGGALLPGVECVAGEYTILCEIFRRFQSEGYAALCRDLNERGIPPPSARLFRAFGGRVWHESTLRTLVKNPHHAGFPAHKVTTNRRGERVTLPPEQWILPDAEAVYPHPIRLPAQESLLSRITARSHSGAPRLRSTALLTGILHCAEGRPCRCNSLSYACRCAIEGRYHPGGQLRRDAAHEIAYRLLSEALSCLPSKISPRVRRPDSADNTDALLALRRDLARKRKELETLRQMETTFQRAGTGESFAATLRALALEIEALEGRQAKEERGHFREEGRAALSQLETVREFGLPSFWEQAEPSERRAILRLVVSRIEICPPQRRAAQVRAVRAIMQPWIAPYYDPLCVPTRRFLGKVSVTKE